MNMIYFGIEDDATNIIRLFTDVFSFGTNLCLLLAPWFGLYCVCTSVIYLLCFVRYIFLLLHFIVINLWIDSLFCKTIFWIRFNFNMLGLICFILSGVTIWIEEKNNIFFIQILAVDGRGVCLQLCNSIGKRSIRYGSPWWLQVKVFGAQGEEDAPFHSF